MDNTLLRVKNLSTYFYTAEGIIKAIDDVSFSVADREIIGIVGESGCGKSVTALSIMRLVPQPPGRIVSGEILYRGQNLCLLHEKQMRAIRGNEISMIFQEPMTALNPVFTIGSQIAEAIRLHQKLGKKAAWQKTVEMLNLVGMPSPEKQASSYPHELSGGMKQRALIAMALSCNPSLLLADEPTTALDVTIQAQILDLMLAMRQKFQTAIVLITHDLGVIAEMAEKVIVMYAGRIMEQASVVEIFKQPQHPYTRGLLNSIPRLSSKHNRKKRLTPIPGMVPNLANLPDGCKFAPRCAEAKTICRETEPELREISPDHLSRCWLNRV